ncbi:hypothetical protein CRE_11530, partial [Caenorhabditis remanei]
MTLPVEVPPDDELVDQTAEGQKNVTENVGVGNKDKEDKGSVPQPMEVEENVSLSVVKKTREMFLKLAKEDTGKMLKTYAKANASTHESIMKPFIDLIVSTFQTLDAKEEDCEELAKENKELEKENEEVINKNEILQSLLEGMQDRELGGTSNSKQAMEYQMVSMLASEGINTLEDLEEVFGNTEKLQKLIKMQNDVYQASQQKAQQMEAEIRRLKKALKDSESRVKSLKGTQAEKEEQTRFIELNQKSNSFSRIGECTSCMSLKEMNSQIKENASQPTKSTGTTTLTSGMPQKVQKRTVQEQTHTDKELEEVIEAARGQMDSESDSERADETIGNGRYYTNWDTGKQKEMSPVEMMNKMLVQQNLPEPPKFSAEENSIKLESFRKSFALKFESCSDENQIILLETKYLSGRALRIFRGLPEHEKKSINGVMQAMAIRLRISPEDETRRAKSRWESLRKKPEQNIEDFCLSIDELARVAFKRVNASELSSFKTAKLLDAIAENETLSCLIDNRLLGMPERDHYDTCRMLATRYEQGIRDRNLRNKSQNSEKKKSPSPQSSNTSSANNTSVQSNPNGQRTNTYSQNRNNFTNKTDNAGSPINQNWRQRTGENSDNNGKTKGFIECSECKLVGCHDPKCSKAPGNAKTYSRPVVTCYRCQEQGHIATYCTMQSQNKVNDNPVKENTVNAVEDKQGLTIPSDAHKTDNTTEKPLIKVEKGRIGNTEVDLMLDSGACISIIPQKIWKKIVGENGEEWVKKVKEEKPELAQVFTANNQPLKLLCTVEVETSMQTRTRLIKYYIAAIDRENIILGMDQFNKLGVEVRIEEQPRAESSSESETEVWNVIQSFQNIFAIEDSELGRTNATTCEIELLDGAEPIRQKPRPIPLAIRPEIRKILQKMVMQGVIRISKSPWSSPVVIVKKKDGSVRMCVDYRKVNKVVKNNAHPLPHIEATLQSLSGKRIFTTLDLLAGYWQIPLDEKSKEITAFAIGSELYEYNVLPFGLVTSPAVFQATMEAVVGDLLGKTAYVYVDDLLIASETMEQHVQDLKAVLVRLEKSGMKLRASKCHIAQKEVEYLGHRITPEGVKTEETKVNKMKNFKRPENAEQMRSFLGLTSYYRKFMLNYAQ